MESTTPTAATLRRTPALSVGSTGAQLMLPDDVFHALGLLADNPYLNLADIDLVVDLDERTAVAFHPENQ